MIEIKKGVFICEDSLDLKFSRSSGPGGQNVNKINSKVTVLFDVTSCDNICDSDKERIFEKLFRRINKNGQIQVVSQRYRTQEANRRAAIEKLAELLRTALQKKAVRKRTKVPTWAKEKRLKKKKQRSCLKQQRVNIEEN
jgi:ribosome-associated protein